MARTKSQKIVKTISVESHNETIRQLFSDTLERVQGISEDEFIALRKDPSGFLAGYLLAEPEVAPEKMNVKQLKAKLTELGLPLEKDGKKLLKAGLLESLLKHHAEVQAPAEEVVQEVAPAEEVVQEVAPAEEVAEVDAPAEEVAEVEAPAEEVAKVEAPAEEVLSPKKIKKMKVGDIRKELERYGETAKTLKGIKKPELVELLAKHMAEDNGEGVGLPEEVAQEEAEPVEDLEAKAQEVLLEEVKNLQDDEEMGVDLTLLIEYDIQNITYHINPDTNFIYDQHGNHVATYNEHDDDDNDDSQLIWTKPQYSQAHADRL